MTDYSLTGHMQSVVDRFAGDLHTCLPARIIGLDYKTQKATVQPLIKMRYTDAGSNPDGLVDMSSIPSVPLIFPSSKFATMTFPVKAGDLVLLVFSQRSVDTFKYSDGSAPIDPNDYRMHDYSDAFAICGLGTFTTALGIDPDNTVIRMNAGQSNESKIVMKPDGNVEIYSSNQMVINTNSDTIINSSANAIVNAESATVNCDSTINGNLAVNGDVTISGISSAQDHLSSGISGSSHHHPFIAKSGTDNLVTNAPS
jgi:phage baseplate assembly protein gpV